MAYILRWINLVLILVFFVIALVATCPVEWFKLNMDDRYGQTGTVQVTLWEFRDQSVSMTNDNGVTVNTNQIPRARTNYLNCTGARDRFRAIQAFSIAGTVLGFYSFLICLLMCACCLKVKLPLFIFLCLAFISEFCAVIAAALAFTQDSCKDKINFFASLKSSGYSIGIGFILTIISCVGYLACFIITPFTQVLWCGDC